MTNQKNNIKKKGKIHVTFSIVIIFSLIKTNKKTTIIFFFSKPKQKIKKSN